MTRKAPPSYETQALRDLEEVIRGRRTINLYLQTPVPRALVREAIDAATWAPNHHVTEPWHFYLLGQETVERCLDLCFEIVRANKSEAAAAFKREQWSEKPGWLVVTCRRSDDESAASGRPAKSPATRASSTSSASTPGASSSSACCGTATRK
jgi:nitroreductase